MKNIKWDEEGNHNTIGSSSSSSDKGKMIIKLKTPPEDDDDVIGILTPEPTTQEEGKKICCTECKKEFSSGKALGGHMRVHVNRNPNFLKPPKFNNGDVEQTKPYYLNSVNHEGKPTCSQCGKTFPSMKSLFGHMRCHPERVWRGILPPPHTATTTTTTTAAAVVDLTRCLPRWPVKEQRGRKAWKSDDDDVVLLEAVQDLLSLANAAGASEKDENNYQNSSSIINMEEIDGAKVEIDDGESDSNGRLLINCKLKVKKPKRIKLMMELESNDVIATNLLLPLPEQQQQQQQQRQQLVVTECKYKCSTCNKCFATHQALGGHRSSHNKPKLTSPNRHPTEEHFVLGESMEKEGVHQCKICDKVFATGQALGGHQRCHWSGATVGPAPTGCDRKVLDFDLNEVAMMEEDEGGNGNWNENGYASSSYNSNIC